MSDICPICGCPEDGGPGPECCEAENERYRERLRALQSTVLTDGKPVERMDVTGSPEDRVLNYVYDHPGKDAIEVAEALGMDEYEVVQMTHAMMEGGLLGHNG